MFVLSELKHLIKLSPRGFDQPIEDQIREELNSKLANRVLLKVRVARPDFVFLLNIQDKYFKLIF